MKVLSQIFSFLLAVVVLYSTTTITLHKHYCGKNLVKTSINIENKGCKKHVDTHKKTCCDLFKRNCCDDEQLVFEGIDHLQLEKYSHELAFVYQIVLPQLHFAEISIVEYLKYEKQPYLYYKPPSIVQPIYLLDEVYLI